MSRRPRASIVLLRRRASRVAPAALLGWSLWGAAISLAAPDARWAAAQTAIENLATEVMAGLESTESASGEKNTAEAPAAQFDLVKRTQTLYGRLTTLKWNPVNESTTMLVRSATVRRDHASIRSRPTAAASRFAQAAKGSQVYVLGESGAWRKVLFGNGTLGWMSAAALSLSPSPLTRGQLEAFVRAAMHQQGVPYLWGGASDRGVDCSGLVYRVLRSFGLTPPRTAAEQYRLGFPVSRGGLRRGDLVFFRNTYKPGISHVGIYLGDNRFLHASSGRGKVTVGSLQNHYYRKHYAGAKRLVRDISATAARSDRSPRQPGVAR